MEGESRKEPSPTLGVVGAAGLVGCAVIELAARAGSGVVAFSREQKNSRIAGVEWSLLGAPKSGITDWIVAAPIWAIAAWGPWMKACGARRIVLLSSTSALAKRDSPDSAERTLAARLLECEGHMQEWARATGTELIILRPTLIYGRGRDRNLSRMAVFARRFRHVPIVGEARGLRQPVHVDDVARACLSAITVPEAAGGVFVVSGAEVVSYREMVVRVMRAVEVPPRLLRLPLKWGTLAGWLGRGLGMAVSPGIAYRMDQDQHFDHSDAVRILGFKPRAFKPVRADLLRGVS